ncbi:MAG TPA: sigma-70 family RNA polymerase sigma factor [Myxococcales bacterium]|nr:sigma-70 family RNA polymerase sigma factor [Myxococcales bacterium]
MSAYAAGDGRAFGILFTRFAPRVHGFFLRSFRDESVADDLLQVTFMKMHRARAQFRPELKLVPWLFAVAARVRLDELRRRLRLPEDAGEEAIALADEQAPRDPPPDTDLRDAVRAALDALPESQRAVIHLHRYEGMTFAEIGQVLGTTAGAAKLRAFRGYETLRQQLKGLL